MERETEMSIQNSRKDQIKPGIIAYYTADGKFKEQQDLNYDNLGNTNGMMLRCFMKDGTQIELLRSKWRVLQIRIELTECLRMTEAYMIIFICGHGIT